MPSVDETRERAAGAVLDAERGLRARGVNPDNCPGLLRALSDAVTQATIAVEAGRDMSEYRAYLDRVRARLDADPVVDGLVEPPRRTLSTRLLDPDWRPDLV
jgi:hypothetical protein